MKKNMWYKIIFITIIIAIFCNSMVFARQVEDDDTQEPAHTNGNGSSDSSQGIIDPDYYYTVPSLDDSNVQNKVNIIIGAIKYGGSIISVVALLVIGIKYMLGSIEEKAEYKKTMIPYLIGIILLFAGSQIVSVIYNVSQGLGYWRL